MRSIDTYAVKSILTTHERDVLPQVDTITEAFSLAQATLNSELEFWSDIKEQMLEENQRLKAIVGIIDKNKLDLGRRITLFSYQRKTGDTDEEYAKIIESREFDSYMYKTYENLNSMTKYIKKLQDVLVAAEMTTIPPTKQPYVFQTTKSNISTEFAKIIKGCELYRTLFTTSTVKSINKLIQNDKNNNSFLDLDVAIRDISTIILPVFDGPKKTLIEPSHGGSKVFHNNKKRKKSLKKRANGKQLKAASSVPSLTTSSMDNAESVKDSYLITEDSSIKASVVEQDAEIISLVAEPIMAEPQPQPTKEDIPEDVNITEIAGAQTIISPVYQPYQKTIVSKVETPLEKAMPQLSFEQKEVVKTLLGQGKEYAQLPVSMSDFVHIIQTLNGHVLRNKKNVHFMIPSWKNDGKWFSKAMHPLHKNDKGNIPRNTKYYWDRAKNLLLEADIEALL